MLDIFYQLLKQVVKYMHIFQWLKIVTEVKFKKAYIKIGVTRSLYQANKTILLDKRFCYIFTYLI